MNSKRSKQKQRVLEYLQDGGELTRIDAWEKLGILECPARICELRQEGFPIITERIQVTNRYDEAVSIAKWSL